ncbi:MAG: transporter substrate-binding domain-containing protein [Nostochopsis sp.]
MGNPKQVMMGGWENRAVGRQTLHPKSATRNYFFRSIGKKIILLLLLFALVIADTQLSASAAELPKIRRRGYLAIAVKDNLRPLGFTDPKGNLQGFEIDLAQQLAADLFGKTNAVKLKPVANRDRLSQVIDHKVDLTIARVTATESRARLVSLSIPYYFDGTRLITKNTSIQKLGDLDKQKIAILKNSSTIADIKYYLPQADLVGVNSYEEGRSLLENNTVVAFAADTSLLSGWVQQYPQYRLVPVKLSTEPLSVVMPKGLQYDDLRRQVNGAIARYLEKGWLQQRAQYWGLP